MVFQDSFRDSVPGNENCILVLNTILSLATECLLLLRLQVLAKENSKYSRTCRTVCCDDNTITIEDILKLHYLAYSQFSSHIFDAVPLEFIPFNMNSKKR